MCGLAGLVCTKCGCSDETHSHIVGRMCELQHHRGPDDSGIATFDAVCLGSNRLKIIDLSGAGHMPMTDPATGWSIVYNGEVYNYIDLRQELIACGHTFNSHTDTEVVLRAFQEWGEACLNRFVGMFAFAIFDPQSQTVILARDRYGKKPLYYTEQAGHILFASELHALMRVCSDVRPNQRRLIEWSLYRNIDFGSQETLVDGINTLEAGQIVHIRNGRLESARPYYVLESHVDQSIYEHYQSLPEHEVVREFEGLIQTSIVDRLVSDVPVGALCSGGIDSSLITAICSKNIRTDFAAFNISVAGYDALDENRYAQQVADSLGIPLHTYSFTGADFQKALPRAIYHNGAPLTHPNSVAFMLISEFARERGVTVLLSGEATDELFGGYFRRYRRLGQMMKAERILKRCPSWLRNAITVLGHVADGVPPTATSTYEGLLAQTTMFIDQYAREDLRIRCEHAYRFVENKRDRAIMATMLADVSNFLTPLLRRLDRMSMAGSVECRVPFLDHRLVHAAINLPMKYKLRGRTDKWLIKKIASGHLPHAIINRKKSGFPLPVTDYLSPIANPSLFKGGFCTQVLGMHETGLLENVESWRSNVHGFFNLLALEIWGRLFFLNESVDEITERIGRSNVD
ncbi:MAG: asparagine synthase (glutamine-hydrolyzing) [Woeseiaceae bacterium]|nr:asparagine synthase (glutamine-hydrolyzing) [Woeseiaceae bacterium]